MTEAQIKLNDPIQDFKYFAEDQILTADDLNLVVDFLDRQQRMTRTYMMGVGVVAGLAPSRLSFNRIALTKGAAVTTDGDLLVVDEDAIYTHFSLFRDPDAKYGQFRRANNQPIRMWEVFTEGGADRASLSQFTDANNPDFEELVVVLYLESFLDPEEDCDGPDCDKRGDRQVRNLKLLLVKRDDLEDLQGQVNKAKALPAMTPTRLNIGGNRIARYRGAGGLAQRFQRSVNVSRGQLLAAVTAIQQNYRPMLDAVIGDGDSWGSLLNQARFRPGANSRRAQYVYDFFRDIADAYNEWRECVCTLPLETLPDPNEFPKHVVLGEPRLNSVTTQLTRHFFRPSALLKEHGDTLKRCFFLLRRIDVMIRSFRPSAIATIRLTPSKNFCHGLGQRAIPYYYDVANDINPRDVWSFSAYDQNLTSDLLCYHANEDNAASAVAKSPFSFDIAQYDFLRVEGHLGKKLEDVEEELEKLKKEHNVSFEVVAVAVDDIDNSDKLKRVRLPKKLRFPDLDSMFRLKKIDVLNSVREATEFGVFTKAEIEKIDDHEDKVKAKEEIERFNVQMFESIKVLPRTLNDFTVAKTSTFKDKLDRSYELAERFERVSTDIFRPTKITPIQNFLQPKRFRDFTLIHELYEKRKEKVQESLFFSKFKEERPGMDHLGGVFVGKTLVLVYEVDSMEVLADFCLPYAVCLNTEKMEPEDLEEPEEPELPKIEPIPLPDLKPPILFKPPFIFNPKPWRITNKLKVDIFRGEKIKTELEKTKVDLETKFGERLNNAKLDFGTEIINKFDTERRDFQVDIDNRFQAKQLEFNRDFDVKIERARSTFVTEVDSKINTLKFNPKDNGLNIKDVVVGNKLKVNPGLVQIVEDLNDTRETQIKLQSKRAVGAELSLEEKAALDQADARIADLVIEATELPELNKKTLDAPSRGLVETIRNASLGVEHKTHRKTLARRFEALDQDSSTAKELMKIRGVLVRD